MDIADHVPSDRVVAGLVPDVGEIVVFGFLLHLAEGFVAAVSIDKEHAVIHQALPDPAEVAPQVIPGLEDLITEVHRQDQVYRWGLCREHVVVEQCDPLCNGAIQCSYVVVAAPVQYLTVQIHGISLVGLAPLHPLGAGVGCTTEIFAQSAGPPAAQGSKSVIHHIDFSFDTLHSLLVQQVAISLVSLRFSGSLAIARFALLWAHVFSLRYLDWRKVFSARLNPADGKLLVAQALTPGVYGGWMLSQTSM